MYSGFPDKYGRMRHQSEFIQSYSILQQSESTQVDKLTGEDIEKNGQIGHVFNVTLLNLLSFGRFDRKQYHQRGGCCSSKTPAIKETSTVK
jgi:hypothetical protein